MRYTSQLKPLARFRTLREYEEFCASAAMRELASADDSIIRSHASEKEWSYMGYSILGKADVDFLVDQQSGGYFDGEAHRPNLRERLVCPITHLNNRQRLVCTLTLDRVFDGARVYFMEQVTPVYLWGESNLENCDIIGSEYLGFDVEGGCIVNGLRHEDVENLSFSDHSLDLIVSNEVLEHVPHPRLAFSECARVLRRGGRAIITIPFCHGADKSVTRAELTEEGAVRDLLEPVYHGNPVSEKGSLVFTDFGWDVLEAIKDAGFRDCWVDMYHSAEFGHLGDGLLVFEAAL